MSQYNAYLGAKKAWEKEFGNSFPMNYAEYNAYVAAQNKPKDGPTIKRLPYKGPKERREPKMGWLHMWFVSQPGEQPPARKQYCSTGQVKQILKYWGNHTFAILHHKFIPDTPNVLDTILAPEKKPTLQTILEG